MTIEELNNKHGEIHEGFDGYEENHVKLSIEFAISVLEDLKFRADLMSDMSSKTHGYGFLCDKIQELKTYLDEKS